MVYAIKVDQCHMNEPFHYRVAIVIPLLNGGEPWVNCLSALKRSLGDFYHVLIVDSGSSDGSNALASSAGFDLLSIDKGDFDHGGTRQVAADYLMDFEFLVFMTQDAILASLGGIENLLSAFSDSEVGVAYGRQLPRDGASPIEAHARLFNYPEQSNKRTLADKSKLGIKAAFTSNSFAAYRTKALVDVGGFPSKLILGEDMVVAARMLLVGWSVAYVADAQVYHSHGYTVLQEFKRYFDIGVMHQDQSWILDTFGKPEGEGMRFIRSELSYLAKTAPWMIPQAVARTFAKYAGYKLGLKALRFPVRMRRMMSMSKNFWNH